MHMIWRAECSVLWVCNTPLTGQPALDPPGFWMTSQTGVNVSGVCTWLHVVKRWKLLSRRYCRLGCLPVETTISALVIFKACGKSFCNLLFLLIINITCNFIPQMLTAQLSRWCGHLWTWSYKGRLTLILTTNHVKSIWWTNAVFTWNHIHHNLELVTFMHYTNDYIWPLHRMMA